MVRVAWAPHTPTFGDLVLSYAPARARSRAPWIVFLLVPLLALAGLLTPTTAAHAAPGDVAGASLQWGVKQSFREYVTGFGGGRIVTSGVDDATPFGWSGGTGTATDGVGTVAYPGTLTFQAHPGAEPDSYELDIAMSDVRVVVASATAASIRADIVSRDATTGEPVSYADATIAELDLGAGVATGSETSLGYADVPAALTATGAAAFGGFYTAGTALDPVTFTWPVEQASAPEPEPVVPTLEVTPSTGLDPEGATITITGTDFATDYANRHGGGKAGVYVQIGWIDDTWRPSEGADASTRNNAYQRWVKENPTAGLYLQWTETGPDRADFSWTVEIDKATLDAKARTGATLAVFTSGAGGTTQPENELAVPLSFAVPTPPGGGSAEPPAAPTPPALTTGSLTWGVKASFRSYLTGPAAHGTITTTGTTSSGGAFVFPQSGDARLSNGTGTVGYSGTVRFTGHEGVLDLRLSDPQLRIDSASSGTLSLRVNGTRVAFATLALGAGTSSTDATGAVRYSGVPATLTAAGARAFTYQGSEFYPAGTALDPVAFVIGAAGSAPAGTVVVASATSRTAHTPDPTPPATEGITVTAGEAVEGGELTVQADGFQPNETGILAVIYSEPTLLADDLTADADGRVVWTGELPRGLTGTHTLTFQGSVDRGVVLEIAAAEETVCAVTDARLVWGFKETFRAYIDGSIANGEWTTGGDASYATPDFTWSGGSGERADADALEVAFSGWVRFVGHGGVLDTTVENPRVVIDGDRAVLLVDIHGTTQSGEAVDETAVEFATLDPAAATHTREGDVVTIAGIPAVLTAAGSAAFGTYPAGETLDPLTLVATVDGACADEPATPAAPSDEQLDTSEAGEGWPVWLTVLLIALIIVAILAAVIVVLQRRRP